MVISHYFNQAVSIRTTYSTIFKGTPPTEHFAPKSNTVYETLIISNMKQEGNESFDNFSYENTDPRKKMRMSLKM